MFCIQTLKSHLSILTESSGIRGDPFYSSQRLMFRNYQRLPLLPHLHGRLTVLAPSP
ncbi:hypothetical protein DPMN_115286 [Dreissena polymorpha]|uniref:Uncharacterized protein n=1 Tax=Dreissena polymorpha TaxID=45954 RepID=A0A9D4KLF9_DREPO|nr:hypothetical protein DPMN_115286 [Dreissena polymorpha]